MKSNSKKCIFAGTFDPITNGHVDIINRSSKLFDKVLVAVSYHKKNSIFSFEERISFCKKATLKIKNVSVIGFKGLTSKLSKKKKINVFVRGLRNIFDFQKELELFRINSSLKSNIETIILFSSRKYSILSSSLVKEIVLNNGIADNFLPIPLSKEIKRRLLKN
ncbi:MAG: pantetheine-phosphate adenylyltransferase [Enterobacteriaceae bacterium]